MTKNKKGFTLIELMIVVAIIAIIAAIAIPGLLRARISANEGAAIGTLRTVSTSQEQFKNQSQVDQDNDGSGEFGTFNELSGTSSRRGGGSLANPTFVTPVLGPPAGNALAAKSGYQFQMFLPGTAATGVIDTGTGTLAVVEAAGPIVDAQETHYRAYAWPVSFNTTGIRCFAVDQAGEVLAAPNQAPPVAASYTGAATTPTFTAAADPATAETAQDFVSLFKAGLANGANDAQIWTSAGQ